MNRARAKPLQGLKMRRNAVALVLREAVAGILRAEFDHRGVARRLREDRSRRDARLQRVAADDAGDPAVKRRRIVAVDQRVRGLHRQRLEGTSHGEEVRLPDVERVDLLDAGRAYAPGNRTLLDPRRQHVPAFLGQLLGVVEPVDPPLLVEDDRRRHDRSGQRAAARLVDAADNLNDVWASGSLEQVHGSG